MGHSTNLNSDLANVRTEEFRNICFNCKWGLFLHWVEDSVLHDCIDCTVRCPLQMLTVSFWILVDSIGSRWGWSSCLWGGDSRCLNSSQLPGEGMVWVLHQFPPFVCQHVLHNTSLHSGVGIYLLTLSRMARSTTKPPCIFWTAFYMLFSQHIKPWQLHLILFMEALSHCSLSIKCLYE